MIKRNALMVAIGLALSANGAPLWASAASTTVADDEIDRLDAVISVASRVEQPLSQIAGSVSVIEREERARHLVENIQDAVRFEPGVSVNEDSGRFGLGGFSIRGIDGNRVGIEIDGIPIREGFAIGSFSRATRNAVDPAFLGALEILRGPASTLHGSDALGGMVSFRTVDVADLLPRDDAFGGELRAGALGREDSVQASVVAATQWDGFGAVFGWVDRQGDQRENKPRDGGFKANPQQRESQDGLLKMHGDLGEAWQWRALLNQRESAVQTAVNHLIRGPAQYATTNRLNGDDAETDQRIGIGLQAMDELARIEGIDALLYWQDSELDQFTQQWRDAVAPRTPATRRDRRFLMQQDTLGLKLQGQAHTDWWGVPHWHVFGLDLARNRLSELRDGSETNLASGAITNVILGERFPVRDFPDSRSRELGLFWQDEIKLSPRWAVIPGLRYERYDIAAERDPVFIEDNPNSPIVDLQDSSLSGKFGVRFDASEQTQWFAQYAQGFRMPSMTDLNIGFTVPAFNYVAIPNPDLKPERSHGLELGMRWHNERADLEIAAYDNRYRNLIDSRVNIGRNAQGQLVFQSINRQRARIRGVEMRGGVDLPWSGWSLQGSVAWAQGDDTARAVPLNSIDPAKATLGVKYQSANGKHQVELIGTAIARKDDIDSTATPFETPGVGTIDLFYHWQALDAFSADVGVFNLTDRRYWLWGSVRGLANDAREVDLASQPGRNLGVNLTWRF